MSNTVQKAPPKRKTKTSTAVKTRYNEKHYTLVSVRLPKDLVEQFKVKCANTKTPQAAVFKAAIEEFLKNNEKK